MVAGSFMRSGAAGTPGLHMEYDRMTSCPKTLIPAPVFRDPPPITLEQLTGYLENQDITPSSFIC